VCEKDMNPSWITKMFIKSEKPVLEVHKIKDPEEDKIFGKLHQ